MLFLFNDVVFDVGAPDATALNCDVPIDQTAIRALTLPKVIKLVREGIFDNPNLAREAPDKAMFLSAMLAWKTGEANALLAVRPVGISDPMDVSTRLADVSIVAIQQLHHLQESNRLTARAVNEAVWSMAPQRLQA